MSPAPHGPAAQAPLLPEASEAPPSRLGTIFLALGMGLWITAFMPRPNVLGTLPAFVCLLALAERCRKTRHAIGYVLLFGAVGVGFGYRWLALTVRTFGELDERIGAASVPVSWAILAVYGMAGTIHGVLFVWLYRVMLRGPRRPHPLATVIVFVACEALPLRFLPWMAGYGAVEVTPLRQVAEWGGVSLVSIGILSFAAPLHEALRWALADDPARPARLRAAAVTLAVGLALYGGGWWRAAAIEAEDAAATARLRVGIVQANVGSQLKRRAERNGIDERGRNRVAYERGSRRVAEQGAELIVWPETAVVDGLRVWDARAGKALPASATDRLLREAGYGFLGELGQTRALLLGGYADEAAPSEGGSGPSGGGGGRGGGILRFNVGAFRAPGAASWALYRKVKLIPFGESMPGSQWIPSLANLLPQGFHMSAGTDDQRAFPWTARGLTLLPFICYEGLAPELLARLADGVRPDLLVNLTNDSWFGDTWEPHQHLHFSRFRAVEHRAPMIRSTNTGVSAIVSATGEVLERLPYDTEGTIVRDVPLVHRDRTLYARIAPFVRWILGVAALLCVFVTRVRRTA